MLHLSNRIFHWCSKTPVTTTVCNIYSNFRSPLSYKSLKCWSQYLRAKYCINEYFQDHSGSKILTLKFRKVVKIADSYTSAQGPLNYSNISSFSERGAQALLFSRKPEDLHSQFFYRYYQWQLMSFRENDQVWGRSNIGISPKSWRSDCNILFGKQRLFHCCGSTINWLFPKQLWKNCAVKLLLLQVIFTFSIPKIYMPRRFIWPWTIAFVSLAL